MRVDIHKGCACDEDKDEPCQYHAGHVLEMLKEIRDLRPVVAESARELAVYIKLVPKLKKRIEELEGAEDAEEEALGTFDDEL